MLVCNVCQKGMKKLAYSRHKKGSSGAGGNWALRAPIHQRIQRPNLHPYKGMKLCTKCLRDVKSSVQTQKIQSKKSEPQPQPQPQAQA